MAARTWLRASPAAAGPVVSRTRYPCSVVGRASAMAFIGFLKAGSSWSGRALATPGEGPSNVLNCSVSVA